MTKTIFALSGVGNSGKTTTLSFLIKIFQSKSLSEPKNDDFQVFKYRGYKIAISTYGDCEEILNGNVKDFEDNSCDIAITATLSRGATHDVIEKYKRSTGADLHWIDKCRNDKDFELKDFQKAILLFHKVNIAIDEYDNISYPTYHVEPNPTMDSTYIVSRVTQDSSKAYKWDAIPNEIFKTLDEALARAEELNKTL